MKNDKNEANYKEEDISSGKKAKIKKQNIIVLIGLVIVCGLLAYTYGSKGASNIKYSKEILGVVTYGNRLNLNEVWTDYKEIDGKIIGSIFYNTAGGATFEFKIDQDYPVLHNTNIKEGLYLDVWIETRNTFMGLIKLPRKSVHMEYVVNTWKPDEEKDKNSGIAYMTGVKPEETSEVE